MQNKKNIFKYHSIKSISLNASWCDQKLWTAINRCLSTINSSWDGQVSNMKFVLFNFYLYIYIFLLLFILFYLFFEGKNSEKGQKWILQENQIELKLISLFNMNYLASSDNFFLK